MSSNQMRPKTFPKALIADSIDSIQSEERDPSFITALPPRQNPLAGKLTISNSGKW